MSHISYPDGVWAMRSLRAILSMGDASSRPALPPLAGPSLLRVSGIAGIAIAAFCIIYFAWQFTR